MGGFYEKIVAHQSAAAHRAYCVPFAFFSVKRVILWGRWCITGVMIVSFVILYRCALKNRQRSDHFIGNILELYFFLFDGKAVAVRPDGMVLQAVYIPLSDCRDIGRVPSSSMRSSYGEETESRGTHRGVTEHEETQKSDDRTADRSPVRYDIGLHFFPSFCFTQVRGAGGVGR